MQNDKVNVDYYENTDFSEVIKTSANKRIRKKNKRITINISEGIYTEASILDEFMNMGYQNVLKAAMVLGLNQLRNNIFDK